MPTSSNRKFAVRDHGVSHPYGRLHSIWLRIAAILWVLVGTVQAEENLPQVMAEWPIAENGIAPVVSVLVNGRRLNLEIDTGASFISVLPHHRFAFIGTPIERRLLTNDSQRTVSMYKTQQLVIGSILRESENIGATSDPGSVAQMKARGVDGLLSGMAIRDYCLQIDYDLGRCRILSNYTPDDSDVSLEIGYRNGVPVIHTRIGEYGDLVIDTGNQAGFTWAGPLSTDLVDGRDYVRWRNPIVDKPDIAREGILLRSLTIGGSDLKLDNVHGMPAEIATIGLKVLSRFRMTIDYPNAMLYLAPRKTPHKVLAPDASGIALLKDQRGYYVAFVYDGTPASEAGLKRDDRIVTAQGKPATDFTFHELEGLFTQGGKTVTLGLERKGARFERRLALRFPIPYPPKWPDLKAVVRPIPAE